MSTGNFSSTIFFGFFSELFISANVTSKSPLETLSPILTFIDSIFPSTTDGTSTLDLSLSIVTIGSFTLMLSPTFTNISITSTFSKSPISGTSSF